MFLLILGIPLAMVTWVAMRDSSAVFPAVTWALVLATTLASLARRRVRIDASGIEYRTLLRTRILRVDQIEALRLVSGVRSFADTWRPLRRLEVVPRKSTGESVIRINLKVLPEDAVRRLSSLAQEFHPDDG